MTSVMSYQYPPVPQGPEDESYHLPALGGSTFQQQPSFDRVHSPAGRSQGAGGDLRKDQLRRTMSTPNVKKQAQAQADALSAEKRRNKLGYHRTSVACGHCRRRKIRCIPAPGDAQQRCSNCIRLKKECNFFPVDQPPPPGDAGRRDSKSKAFQRDSASPPSASGHPQDMHGGLPYHQLQIPPVQDYGAPLKKPRTDSFSPDPKASSYQRTGDFVHPGTGSWTPSDAAVPKLPGDISSTYGGWGRMNHDSPMTPAFSPFSNTSQIPPNSAWPSSASTESGPRDPIDWSQPQRSMSYSSLENLPNQSPYPNFHQASSGRAGMGPDPYNPALTPSSSVPLTEGVAAGTPTSASGNPPPPPFPVQSQTWPSYTYDKAPLPSSSGGYAPAQWYPQGPPLPSQSPQQGPYPGPEQQQYTGVYGYPPPPPPQR